MKYTELLLTSRRRSSTVAGRLLGEESQSDLGRVLFSPAFRRLQQKAQVFPLEDNAAVRSRLTHSLEVAYLGRLIALKVIDLFEKRNALEDVGLEDRQTRIAFINFIEVACLVHDIGNPPFGHFGEFAVRSWFKNTGLSVFKANLGALADEVVGDEFTKNLFPDFINFDGNAQGFRILTRLQWDQDEYSLNLSHSQLASFLKYTVCPSDVGGERFSRKPGFFYSEKDIVQETWSALRLPQGQRFPLAYVMEAADDIAYCLSDIEDGLEKRILLEDQFKDELLKISKAERDKLRIADSEPDAMRESLLSIWSAERHDQMSQSSRFFRFKIVFTRTLVDQAAKLYVDNHDAILRGESGPLLDTSPSHKASLQALKTFARKFLFSSPEAQRPELAGFKIVSGLLDHLTPLLQLSRHVFSEVRRGELVTGRNTDLERRLVRLLPSKYLLCYDEMIKKCCAANSANIDRIEVHEWFLRAHLVVDYIAGMTDGFALDQYQLLSGIQI